RHKRRGGRSGNYRQLLRRQYRHFRDGTRKRQPRLGRQWRRNIQPESRSTLILGETGGSGPTLRGLEHDDVYKGNSRATVKIANGGTITANYGTNEGGGVYINGGTFAMNGGTIIHNLAGNGNGGGVFVAGSGTFTQSGRSISENVGNDHYNDVYNAASQ
ncbi:MAG: hypothetical protein LBP81_05590, partial [Treponema sp.]|nr:hypothetical protein [Treponema sp.]